MHPIYNLVVTKAIAATHYFSQLPVPTEADCSKPSAAAPEAADLKPAPSEGET